LCDFPEQKNPAEAGFFCGVMQPIPGETYRVRINQYEQAKPPGPGPNSESFIDLLAWLHPPVPSSSLAESDDHGCKYLPEFRWWRGAFIEHLRELAARGSLRQAKWHDLSPSDWPPNWYHLHLSSGTW